MPSGVGLSCGAGAHAPSGLLCIKHGEGVKVASLADMEKAYVDLLYSLGDAE